MKKEKILNYCMEQQESYRDTFGVVSKLEMKKVYRITYAYNYYLKDPSGNFAKVIRHNTVIGQVIAFNSESVRIKVVAADKGIRAWGREQELSDERDSRNKRQDTLYIKYRLLVLDGCDIIPVDKDELITNVGCKFIHKDFSKHLEAA